MAPEEQIATVDELMNHVHKGDLHGTIWKGWRDTPYPYQLASVGSRVMKETRSTATAVATGEQIEMDFMEVLEFKDDLIHTIRPYYWDPELVRRVTAGSPPAPSRGTGA